MNKWFKQLEEYKKQSPPVDKSSKKVAPTQSTPQPLDESWIGASHAVESDFEREEALLFPKLALCSYANLTPEERKEWSGIAGERGRARESGDIEAWRKGNEAFLKIAEKVRAGIEPKRKEEMTTEEFAIGDHAVRIKSNVLGGEEIYLISNENVRDRLKGEGLVCYLPNEIEILKSKTSEQIRIIHQTKKVFNDGEVIE